MTKEKIEPTRDNTINVPRLLTIKQFCSQFQWPSESGIRAYIYRADEYGLSKAFLRVGRRVLINVDIFFELIKQAGK